VESSRQEAHADRQDRRCEQKVDEEIVELGQQDPERRNLPSFPDFVGTMLLDTPPGLAGGKAFGLGLQLLKDLVYGLTVPAHV
jgi:hypothetical protein